MEWYRTVMRTPDARRRVVLSVDEHYSEWEQEQSNRWKVDLDRAVAASLIPLPIAPRVEDVLCDAQPRKAARRTLTRRHTL